MISLQLTNDQLDGIDAALGQLESALAGLIALTPDERRSLARMGPKSESFCRQTLSVLEQNPQMVPASLDLAGARGDLTVLDQLRPRFGRLQRLAERAADSETALGSDVMDVALEGYSLLKVSGRGQGLDGLRRELGSRFARARRAEAAPA
jgi:hypothetical protein